MLLIILFALICLIGFLYAFVRFALRTETHMLHRILQHMDDTEDTEPTIDADDNIEGQKTKKFYRLKGVNLKGDMPKIFSFAEYGSLIKLGIIGFICLISIIPLDMLNDVVYERSRYADSATESVIQSWADRQLLSGPVVNVPYVQKRIVSEKIKDKDSDGKVIEKTITKEFWDQHNRIFLPDNINLTTDQSFEIRKRGIFNVPLYTASFQMEGTLPLLDFSDKSDETIIIDWEKAEASFLVGDTAGIKFVDDLAINNDRSVPLSGFGWLAPPKDFGGFHYQNISPDCQGTNCSFAVSGELNGVKELSFAPIARSNHFTVASTWPHPKFVGNGLPESHNITSQGFNAQWKTSNLVRSYPQVSNNTKNADFLNDYIVGFETITTVGHYSKILRAAKYGILIVGLSLFALFIFEYGLNVRIHPVQYLVTSGALILFYLTLLSLSEHTEMLYSWIISTVLISCMIAVYMGLIIRSLRYGFVLFAYLVGVYMVMYALLNFEDYALLAGTAILIAVMIVVMYITRKLHKRNMFEH